MVTAIRCSTPAPAAEVCVANATSAAAVARPLASSLATGAALAAFAAQTSASGAGVLQRIAVTIPLAAVAAVAVRLLRTPARSGWP